MSSAPQRVRIKNVEHVVTAEEIIAVAKRESPRRLNAYFVEIEGQRFPPKQLVRGALPLAANFDTGVAVRALQSLGFQVIRLEPA